MGKLGLYISLKRTTFIRLLFATVVALSFQPNLFAQCVSTGALSPATATNNASIGAIAWAGTNNVFTSNNSRSTSTALLFGDVSNYLFVTNFNFAIPSLQLYAVLPFKLKKVLPDL